VETAQRAALRGSAWLSEESVDQLRRLERTAIDSRDRFEERRVELEAQLLPSAEAAPLLQLADKPQPQPSASQRADAAVDDGLGVADDVLALWPGATAVAGDERQRLREAARRAENAASAGQLAWALLQFRNAPTTDGGQSVDFVLLVSEDGSWPLSGAGHVFMVRYGAHPTVAFHDVVTCREAFCDANISNGDASLSRAGGQLAEARTEAEVEVAELNEFDFRELSEVRHRL
jgi:hypothetical protein